MRKRRKQFLSFLKTTFQGIAIASLGTLGMSFSYGACLFGIGAFLAALGFLLLEMGE